MIGVGTLHSFLDALVHMYTESVPNVKDPYIHDLRG